jgi:hypothetical protein
MATKIPVKLITFERAEGLTEECVKVEFKTFAEVNAHIRRAARTAPRKGGYNKCDFLVEYADGEKYEGRYDLTYADATGHDQLQTHMGEHVRFFAGLWCPAHITRQRYNEMITGYGEASRKSYTDFLEKYALEDVTPEPEIDTGWLWLVGQE